MNLPKKIVIPLARSGYFARGVVYMIVGLLALVATWTASSHGGAKDALTAILAQPFGTALIWVMVVGLIGYTTWRLVQSVFDTDDHGWNPVGLGVRAGLLTSGVTYFSMAVFCLAKLGVLPGGGGKEGATWTDKAVEILGAGPVIIAFGIAFTIIASAHFCKAFKRKYADHFDAPEAAMPIVHTVSIIGLTARGIVFGLLAFLMWRRFFAADSPAEKPGTKEALQFLQDMTAGPWIISALSVGIMVFALYSMLEARWRKINVEDATD
jgi:hypothetical protein